ncbi:unnamed protein product [Lathyrus oleraceus]|uniref:RING-CH-type domain-containing protein n=1 Tax=Pisum sativum TaxID=3888 RepID=A0A9D4VKF9_PEA|nr:uncharacterized protein LOC127105193 [Pisum sativum]XP_050898317.1 uncharacterized protein LOC127105193 [Pisum sativum]KAI5384933.1 hypothetical protein KIW84_071787 [Pisum sativum]
MDQATSKGSSEMLDHADEGVNENSSHLVEGVAIDAGAGHSLGGRASVCDDLGLNEELKERALEVKGQNENVGGDPGKIDDDLRGFDQGTSYNSSDLVNGEALETRVVIDSSAQVESVDGDSRKLEAKTNESRLNKLSIKALKGVSETDKNSCVIDVNCGNGKDFTENLDGETICRICHLASGQPLEETAVGTPNSADDKTGLIMLGCACKDELGIAHSHCAEAWFKIKGNRICEICGETAKNVPDVINNGFMEEWCESGFIDSGSTSNSPRGLVGCWRGQPFCNFLMACLVIGFVLPWFFRVKMF